MRNIPYVNIAGQHRPIKNELLEVIAHVIDKGDFILGEQVRSFEARIAEFIGMPFAVGVNSGTDALFLTLKAYAIGEGDEVITAPNSFLATASVIVAAGATPVFVDAGEDMNINPALIEEKITGRTKAIIVVHLTGKPADMDPILAIARRHDIKTIEDAAQAVGAEYRGNKVGSLGDAGCFSLHPLKTLGACGDAGVITTHDRTLHEKLMALRNIGLKNRNESDCFGYNSRLDTIQAAVLLVKFNYFDEWTEKRRTHADEYREGLKALAPFVKVPKEEEYEKAVYHTFVIQAEKRDELKQKLAEAGVGTGIHYPIPIHLQKAAAFLGYKQGDFPVCEKHAETILSLPVYPELTEDDIMYVCSVIKKFYL